MKDIASGKSILFAPRLPSEYAVWLGEIKPPDYFQVNEWSETILLWTKKVHLLVHVNVSCFQERYMVSKVYYVDEIAKVLQNVYQGSGIPLLYLLHGLNTDSDNFAKPAEFQVCHVHTLGDPVNKYIVLSVSFTI